MASNVPVTRRPAVPAETNPFLSLRGDMDRLFERFFSPVAFPAFPQVAQGGPAIGLPAVDLSETDKAYTLTADMPGLTEKDVEVTLTGDTLTIRGAHRQQREEKDKDYHLTERSYGAFRRSFTLPGSIDRDSLAAEVANGVLTVTMPKLAEAGARPIPVKAAA